MKLNTYLIAEQLPFHTDHFGKSDPLYCSLNYCELWSFRSDFRTDTIYIISEHDFTKRNVSEDSCAFIIIGTPTPDLVLNSSCDIITVPSYLRREVVLTCVIEIFERFHNISEQLLELYRSPFEKQKIYSILEQIFSAPLLVLGEFYEALHIYRPKNGIFDQYTFQESDSDFLISDLEELFVCSKPDCHGFSEGVTSSAIPYIMYTAKGNNTTIRLILIDLTNQLTVTYQLLMKYIGEHYLNFYNMFCENRYQNLKLFRHMLMEHLAADTSIENCPPYVIQTWKKIGWKEDDKLICIKIKKNESLYKLDISKNNIPLFKTQSIVLDEHDSIYLCNLSLADVTDSEFRIMLDGLMRDIFSAAGISLTFTSFVEFPFYVVQASAALDMGSQLDHKKHVYRYQDYICDYLIHHGIYSLPIESVLPEGVKQLIAYDKQHKTKYCRTLITFINNDMQQKTTADLLGIHINTMKYRIQKIQKITNIDLYDPDIKLLILLIARLLKDVF